MARAEEEGLGEWCYSELSAALFPKEPVQGPAGTVVRRPVLRGWCWHGQERGSPPASPIPPVGAPQLKSTLVAPNFPQEQVVL